MAKFDLKTDKTPMSEVYEYLDSLTTEDLKEIEEAI